MIANLTYLEFVWCGEGCWEAFSRRGGRMGPLQWRIQVDEDGFFCVGDTDRELLATIGNNKPFFGSLSEAKAWCDRQEGNLKENE